MFSPAAVFLSSQKTLWIRVLYELWNSCLPILECVNIFHVMHRALFDKVHTGLTKISCLRHLQSTRQCLDLIYNTTLHFSFLPTYTMKWNDIPGTQIPTTLLGAQVWVPAASLVLAAGGIWRMNEHRRTLFYSPPLCPPFPLFLSLALSFFHSFWSSDEIVRIRQTNFPAYEVLAH